MIVEMFGEGLGTWGLEMSTLPIVGRSFREIKYAGSDHFFQECVR